ncbi:MAG: dTDP-4-dehydrorhamnose 3,5-epimerase family protein [Candidatus Bathyarchaeia archaeon]|jgi:dTDP-4-dehydrorhamnose 3,5-epimerase
MNDEKEIPKLFEGNLAVDDRGEVAFVNDFRFEGVRRFYIVSNHRTGLVRAWHAHKREAKYMSVIEGAAVIAAVAIDNWEHPSPTAKVHRFVLSAARPSVLFIPQGYANGFMSLTSDCRIEVFSTSTLEESQKDDIRYDARYWDPWQIEER